MFIHVLNLCVNCVVSLPQRRQNLHTSVCAVRFYSKLTSLTSSLGSLASSGHEQPVTSSSSSSRPPSHPYGHQHSPVSPRTQDGVQQRPSVLHNTVGKSLSVSDHSGSSVLR